MSPWRIVQLSKGTTSLSTLIYHENTSDVGSKCFGRCFLRKQQRHGPGKQQLMNSESTAESLTLKGEKKRELYVWTKIRRFIIQQNGRIL
jgi:hypothetical protein